MKILGCTVQYRCPKQWDSLDRTGDEHTRFCGVCQRNVFHPQTMEEGIAHIKNRDCIVAFSGQFGVPADEGAVMGDFDPDPYWQEHAEE